MGIAWKEKLTLEKATLESRKLPQAITETVTRSLFPLMACVLLLLVTLVGPWSLPVTTYVWWRLVTRVG